MALDMVAVCKGQQIANLCWPWKRTPATQEQNVKFVTSASFHEWYKSEALAKVKMHKPYARKPYANKSEPNQADYLCNIWTDLSSDLQDEM